jgi:predicted adenylyl cyclase CyaB
MGPLRNLELKARDPNPDLSPSVPLTLGAVEEGILYQRDTYFKVAQGRLKLREQRSEAGESVQLIAYERPDDPEWKESRYRIVNIESAEPAIDLLGQALPIDTVVTKTRRQFKEGTAQIHLDHVVGLGHFIEFEIPIDADQEAATALDALKRLQSKFKIADKDLVAGSYSDLIRESN